MMFGGLSATAALGILGAICAQATAFELHMYTSKQCTGMPTTQNTDVKNGCSTFGAGSVSSIINRWSGLEDNKLILATYSDENCCHANLIDMMTWTAGCTVLNGTVRSWRVLDPNEPDKGKDGQSYTC